MSTPFQLSRIFAEGWNAAGKLSAEEAADPARLTALNPYVADPEKTRWNEGFAKALAK
ncbi:MAG TPA: hypothetical protein VGT78_01505 [Rhizomicrobium sp.]|nr:hypothetical protein [Rhizomicrobium sp.]